MFITTCVHACRITAAHLAHHPHMFEYPWEVANDVK